MTYAVKLRGSPVGPRSYACAAHGDFEAEVDLATSAAPRPCPECGQPSPRTLDLPLFKPQRVTIGRSHSPKSDNPLDMNTQLLADGMSDEDYRAHRAKVWADHDDKVNRAKGLY